MAHGHDHRDSPYEGTRLGDLSSARPARPWREAVGRGIVLGVVISLHLGLAIRLLAWSPAPLRGSAYHGSLSRRDDDALQVSFVQPRRGNAHRPATHAALRRRRNVPHAGPRRAPAHAPLSAPTAKVVAVPATALSATQATPSLTYRRGDFDRELQAARHPEPLARLPGMDDAPSVSGLRLRAPAPSLQQVVRRIGHAQDCYAEQRDMQHQGNYGAWQIDRLLEADGCGPQADQDDNSPAIHAAVQAIMRGQ